MTDIVSVGALNSVHLLTPTCKQMRFNSRAHGTYAKYENSRKVFTELDFHKHYCILQNVIFVEYLTDINLLTSL